ncbi:unnamed protein product (macronuclear) [Paramecium tetraurelia]|uniref:Uncharacterized protein n=1 Tax=Paramecium tetraurelia TaxID=5888 RepID=A0CEK4_PARTE|nr:uncharacterized protein GSPATT00037659001 [Paramecium tetraurelia]CAK69221.1 unnamed protein product [Paramecium tetraurelia]|eukprot:XP_001436618.1 hypothetical protein (macronuclear) [Paramecium tetraurelia strain d4-2]
MTHPLRVDDFVDELRKYDRKEDFMAVMRTYEQRYYDQFEQFANNNFPPELQRQQMPKQEQLFKQQPQYQKPPIVRSSSANKLDYQDQYQIFPQQAIQQPQIPQRLQSRGEIQDPFKRPQEQFDNRLSPVAQQDPFRGLNKQQYITQQRNPAQIPTQQVPFSPFLGQPVTNNAQQIGLPFGNQVGIPNNNPQFQNYGAQQHQFYEQPIYQQQQTISYPKTGTNQQQQMDAFLNDIRSQRIQKQQQYK